MENDKQMDIPSLTDLENRVLMKTAELWALLTELPKQHDDDIHDFRKDIHAIQHRVMSRGAVREMRGGKDGK